MKLIDCPIIGPRPIAEFTYGGQLRRPPLGDTGTTQLAAYVFHRDGAPGVLREWWHHEPTGRWFVLDRDTRTDTVLNAIDAKEAAYAIPTR